MSAHPFSIVDLLDGNKRWVVIVPTSWLNRERTKCFYPPGQGRALENATKQQEVPRENWIQYDIEFRKSYGKSKIIYVLYCAFMHIVYVYHFNLLVSYSEARKMLHRAEISSDLNTDVEERLPANVDSQGQRGNVRQRKQKNQLLLGEESTSSEAYAGDEGSSSEDEPVLLVSSPVPKPQNNSGINMHRSCICIAIYLCQLRHRFIHWWHEQKTR